MRSLTLVPRSLLLNHTETLATQATFTLAHELYPDLTLSTEEIMGKKTQKEKGKNIRLLT